MIKDLETAIGYRFQNITLLQNALTHSSYANERWHNSLMSNERLEFLGDSILGMVVAEYLYKSFPDRPEGELTRMRADMVCETALAAAANKVELGKHMLLGNGEEQGGGRTRASIMADAFESVIAAAFLDGGMDAAKAFIKNLRQQKDAFLMSRNLPESPSISNAIGDLLRENGEIPTPDRQGFMSVNYGCIQNAYQEYMRADIP